LSTLASRPGSTPEPSPRPATSKKRQKRSIIPCGWLRKPHSFDDKQEFVPGRKLSMRRRCNVCGQNVKGGEILFPNEDPS
jgi:hypothetical protein